ncbi:penicillin acylase family protein [Aestuariibacter salexigens]|uniref:penicillin acylase family protein n=1 Tax=Aestuariibacter salexigens TaxID=226010 RepID=UPI00040F260B|nr:penicillin acylase family protein [Aestuariibacter salexigens]
MKKYLLRIPLILIVAAFAALFAILYSSMPSLDGEREVSMLSADVSLGRDNIGTAVISGENRADIAFALGMAHAQDRLFQMDLLRRNAAGELSEIFGKRALETDKSRRFHQFRQHAKRAVGHLTEHQREVLNAYTAGVNAGAKSLFSKPFEYWLLGADFSPWKAEDSLLVSYSMYLDLQLSQVNRDLALTMLEKEYGPQMTAFIMQPGDYQAALDGSEYETGTVAVPELINASHTLAANLVHPDHEVGSNNWAVTGQVTDTGHAMLADDMHLSLGVPIIWYRSQFNLTGDNPISITGVTLPGTPLMIVGSNTHIAWGFTNANLDNADWIELSDDTPLQVVSETINLPDSSETVTFSRSEYGPVKEINGKRFALAWTAHQPYAVNLELLAFEHAQNVEQALNIAPKGGIPLQNLVVVDSSGNAAWTPMGGLTARQKPSVTAYPQVQYDSRWAKSEGQRPVVYNPDNQRIWTANARVMSIEDMDRFGNGGYAVGARGKQIRDRLLKKETFTEQDFYRIQQDNEARFMRPWQQLLSQILSGQDEFTDDLTYINDWQSCACAESIGYTLVRYFRSEVHSALFAPLQKTLEQHDLSLSPVLRHMEPASWQLLTEQPQTWLPKEYASWPAFLADAYRQSKQRLFDNYADGKQDFAALRWGKVNALTVTHPLASALPLIGRYLNMPEAEGFGDSYTPAVQRNRFGASQRLVVQPGREKFGILTIPGGQSGHPLSDYYASGFEGHVNNSGTPLLPGAIEHKLILSPTP